MTMAGSLLTNGIAAKAVADLSVDGLADVMSYGVSFESESVMWADIREACPQSADINCLEALHDCRQVFKRLARERLSSLQLAFYREATDAIWKGGGR
jgi:hypothetical protein